MTMRALLVSRRFMPLFITQFLGALNDNIFKNALIIFVLFALETQSAAFYATTSAGVFILPFVLFSPLAGRLSDTRDKAKIMRVVKLVEIPIILLAVAGFATQNGAVLLAALFLSGVHSAFFSPAKYSILPQHVKDNELVAANGLLSLGTFAAILIGTMIGALGIVGAHGVELTAGIMLSCSFIGLGTSLFIPPAPPERREKISWKLDWRDARATLYLTWDDKKLRMPAVAISWFWFLGATYLTQFASVVKTSLHGDQRTATAFLVMFTLGVAVGSLLCEKLLRAKSSAKLAAPAALGMVLFGVDFCLAAYAVEPSTLRLMLDLFCTAVAGGIFYVPLYALMQGHTPLHNRARVMAGVSLLNALFMVGSSLLGMIMLALGFSGLDVILAAVLLTLSMVFYTKTR